MREKNFYALYIRKKERKTDKYPFNVRKKSVTPVEKISSPIKPMKKHYVVNTLTEYNPGVGKSYIGKL